MSESQRFDNKKLCIDNAHILFKNFEGRAGDYNAAGERNFCVLIDADIAPLLKMDGWNVKHLKPIDEGDPEQAYIKVKVKYGKQPPEIYLVTDRGKNLLTEKNVTQLDLLSDIDNVDLIITPWVWNDNGDKSAYLRKMWVTIHEDELEKKYYDVPDSVLGTVGGCGHCEACDSHCHGAEDGDQD